MTLVAMAQADPPAGRPRNWPARSSLAGAHTLMVSLSNHGVWLCLVLRQAQDEAGRLALR